MINFLNLQKLLDFIKTNKDWVSGKFTMSSFVRGSDLDHSRGFEELGFPNKFYKEIVHDCGTSCCLVGWSPSVNNNMKLQRGEDWWDYSKRVFGIDGDDLEWEFLFSAEWACIDNTVECAILRLEYFIKMQGDLSNLPIDHDNTYPEFDADVNWKEFLTEELERISLKNAA